MPFQVSNLIVQGYMIKEKTAPNWRSTLAAFNCEHAKNVGCVEAIGRGSLKLHVLIEVFFSAIQSSALLVPIASGENRLSQAFMYTQ